jgi:hypothetical protein
MNRPFAAVDDAWLDDVVYSLEAAAREGAFDVQSDVAAALRREYTERKRLMPQAWGSPPCAPERWGNFG